MEPQPKHDDDFSSTVDTSRPFTSVREAVAIFGERLLVGEIYSPKPFSESAYNSPLVQREPSWRLSSPPSSQSPALPRSPSPALPPPSPMKLHKGGEEEEARSGGVLDTLKKLEAELEKTKVELKMLKERGSETEVALATLNAELHKNMSKLAQAEAAAAGKAAAATKTVRFEISEREKGGGDEIKEEKKNDEHNVTRRRTKESKSLAQIMSLGENDHLFYGKKQRKNMRQKPIIPLVGDLFFKKKASSTNHHNPLYASPF